MFLKIEIYLYQKRVKSPFPTHYTQHCVLGGVTEHDNKHCNNLEPTKTRKHEQIKSHIEVVAPSLDSTSWAITSCVEKLVKYY